MNPSTVIKSHRSTLLLFFAFLLFSLNSNAQTDTLHLYYRGLETKIHDSTEAKIAAWAKSLKGKKVDVEVIAYYNDAQFKKYAQERSDELFIVINRKARDLMTIKSIGPKRGAKSQRSMADIVYTFQGTTPAPVAEEKKKEDKNNKTAGAAAGAVVGVGVGAATNTSNKNEKADTPAPEEKKAKEEKVAAEPKPAKAEKSNSKYDVIMDTTYVNGVMKITKRKVKKQQQ
jgi:hypothetical protein